MSTNATPIAEAVAAGRQAVAVDAAMIAKLTNVAGDAAINLSIAILIFVVTLFVSKWASKAVRRALSRVRGFRHDPTVLSFAVQVVRVIVIIMVSLTVSRLQDARCGLHPSGRLEAPTAST